MSNPIVLAAIGVVVTVIAYNLAGLIANRWMRGLAQLASVLGTLALLGLLAHDVQVSQQVGEYYFIGIVIAYGLGKLLGGSAKA